MIHPKTVEEGQCHYFFLRHANSYWNEIKNEFKVSLRIKCKIIEDFV